MNQILNATRPDLRSTDTAWSAPATPSFEYDDGNPATIVPQFRHEVRPVAVAQAQARQASAAFDIPRSSFADYDDGNPGTVIA